MESGMDRLQGSLLLDRRGEGKGRDLFYKIVLSSWIEGRDRRQGRQGQNARHPFLR